MRPKVSVTKPRRPGPQLGSMIDPDESLAGDPGVDQGGHFLPHSVAAEPSCMVSSILLGNRRLRIRRRGVSPRRCRQEHRHHRACGRAASTASGAGQSRMPSTPSSTAESTIAASVHTTDTIPGCKSGRCVAVTTSPRTTSHPEVLSNVVDRRLIAALIRGPVQEKVDTHRPRPATPARALSGAGRYPT